MREASFCLPPLDNDGRDLAELHKEVRFALCHMFGGCTAVEGRGCWVKDGRVYDERMIEYRVAIAATTKAEANDLRSYGMKIAHAAGQLALYFRWPDGTVEIINLDHLNGDA